MVWIYRDTGLPLCLPTPKPLELVSWVLASCLCVLWFPASLALHRSLAASPNQPPNQLSEPSGQRHASVSRGLASKSRVPCPQTRCDSPLLKLPSQMLARSHEGSEPVPPTHEAPLDVPTSLLRAPIILCGLVGFHSHLCSRLQTPPQPASSGPCLCILDPRAQNRTQHSTQHGAQRSTQHSAHLVSAVLRDRPG